jgi:hypothetical protein
MAWRQTYVKKSSGVRVRLAQWVLPVGYHVEAPAAVIWPLCSMGHDNWFIDSRGRRQCRTCKNATQRARRQAGVKGW